MSRTGQRRMREQEDASGHGPGGLLSGGLDALQNGAILAATPFAILMCLMCWCPYKTLRRDYREERRQVREVMAHDQNVEKQQMQEIMRRHKAGEPVSPISQNPKE